MLNFKEEYILENKRVKLVPLKYSDLKYLTTYALHELELWEYSLMAIKNTDDLKSYIYDAIKARELEKEYTFIIFDKSQNQYVGTTRFYDIQPQNESLLIGYTWISKSAQRTGLNKNCKFLLLEFAFETLYYKRVELRADSRNIKSIAAMQSIGCTIEGCLRQHLPLPDGTRRDSIILSVLADEWSKTIRKNLCDKISSK